MVSPSPLHSAPLRYGTPFRSEAVQTSAAVTHEWYGISFAGSYGAPRFVAFRSPGTPVMATYNGPDNYVLRYRNLAASGVEVKVEDDTILRVPSLA